ncbi:MAG: histidine phosphatase family protein [Anaerolineales bacterium]
MTIFFLVRHGETEQVGRKLSGWTPGVHLNARGQDQAKAVADSLRRYPIQAIYSSPLERALETAAPLAKDLHLPVHRRRTLGEVDYGDFTGRSFRDLERLKTWQLVRRQPSRASFPGGESLLEVQSRTTQELWAIAQEHPRAMVAVFSHGDAIRLALAYVLGLPLDLYQRLMISPASISAARFFPQGTQVLALNVPAGCFPPFQPRQVTAS